MKATFEEAVRGSEFSALGFGVHGDVLREDFDSIPSMRSFFARRKNIVRVILAEKNVRLYWLPARHRRL